MINADVVKGLISHYDNSKLATVLIDSKCITECIYCSYKNDVSFCRAKHDGSTCLKGIVKFLEREW